MESRDRLKLLLFILLPLLAMLALPVSPRPVVVDRSWSDLQLSHAQNRPADSARSFSQILALQPWRSDLWEPLGKAQQEADNLDEAIAAYQKALAADQLSIEGQFALGDAFLQSGRLDQAKTTWEALAQRISLEDADYQRLFEIQVGQKNLPAARGVLRAWLVHFPENAEALYWQGLYLAAEQPHEAYQSLAKAASIDFQYASVQQQLEPVFREASQSNDEGFRRLVIGRGLAQINEWMLAAEAFDSVVRLQPQWAEAWAFLGEAQQHIGRDGWPALQNAQKLDSDSVIVSALIALYWRRQGNAAAALPYLQAAAEAEPRQAIWQVEMGNAYSQMGDLGRALIHFQKASELEPENALVWEALAAFSANNGIDISGVALPAARKALLLAPDDPTALDLMGWVLYTAGDLDSAERFLQQALQKAPSFAAAHLHLGQVFLEKNDREQARIHLQEAKRLGDPQTIASFAQRLLDQIQ